ncbi:uncharacterized protein LOC114804558 [Zeugodacus cucurbitae]|uniref:uncharacterized protein LOC114804558 n=1 Tax=Zeugodacus cucurbitae TaxID=28588 RepID=UPI0023D96A71|nr:uncharacterized protein LOC114804558 [Zeugodacus cucurbitae]
MASNVLALIIATVFLISFACASVDNTDKAFAQAEYDIINDTASFAWQDLRNEIHQGDAITYELGTPQYKILNADEPIEIITPDQPGYYQSLKRYVAAAKQEAEKKQHDAPTTPPEDTKTLTKVRKDKQEASQLSIGEKKIRFIILNSKKKSKNSKIYLDSPKSYQQDAKTAETRKTNSERPTIIKPVLSETEPWAQQISDVSEVEAKGVQEERIALSKSVQDSKQNESISLKSNGSNEVVKPLEENYLITSTENIIINNSSTQVDQKFVQELPSIESLPAKAIPAEAAHQLPPMFLTYDTPSTEDTSAALNSKPKEPSATAMSSNAPIYEAPPHIRDFEYLYRSALGIR